MKLYVTFDYCKRTIMKIKMPKMSKVSKNGLKLF